MRTTDTAVDIQMKLRRWTLDLRGIDRLIQGTDFNSLWNRTKAIDRIHLIDAIAFIDLEAVKQRLFEMKQNDLTKRELLEFAKRYNVKNYSRKTKNQLRRELQKYEIIQTKC